MTETATALDAAKRYVADCVATGQDEWPTLLTVIRRGKADIRVIVNVPDEVPEGSVMLTPMMFALAQTWEDLVAAGVTRIDGLMLAAAAWRGSPMSDMRPAHDPVRESIALVVEATRAGVTAYDASVGRGALGPWRRDSSPAGSLGAGMLAVVRSWDGLSWLSQGKVVG